MSPIIMFSGGYPGQSPLDLGATIWWDFSDQSTLYQDAAQTSPITATGQEVKGVKNKANPGTLDLSATNGPTFRSNQVNNRHCVEFDGSTDSMYTTGTAWVMGNANYDGGFTGFSVFTTQRVFGAETGGWGPGDSLLRHSTNKYLMCGSTFSGEKLLTHHTTSGSACIARKGTVSLNTWYIGTHMGIGSGDVPPNWDVSTYVGLSDTRTASLITAQVFNGGYTDTDSAFYVSDTGFYWDGYVGTICLWTEQNGSLMSEADRKDLETYFSWYYGISIPY